MSNYARANRSAAWYADNYRGATINLGPKTGVGCIHTTEGTSLPGYNGGATAPNYTAVPDFDAETLRWFAHFPDEMSSRALQNLTGGVETNTLNVAQVELVGTCDPAAHRRWGARHIFWPEAPRWALEDLAHFVADMNRRHGLQIRGVKDWLAYGPDPRRPGVIPASYGNSPARLSGSQWRNFVGWLGHQHMPENSHGDPGALDWPTVERLAQDLVKPKEKPEPKPDPKTRGKVIDEVNLNLTETLRLLSKARAGDGSRREQLIEEADDFMRQARRHIRRIGFIND